MKNLLIRKLLILVLLFSVAAEGIPSEIYRGVKKGILSKIYCGVKIVAGFLVIYMLYRKLASRSRDKALLTTVKKNDWTTLEKVKKLVKANADINWRDHSNVCSALMYACKFCRPDIVKELLAGASFTNENDIGSRDEAFLTTVKKNDWTTPEKVKMLLKANADINVRDHSNGFLVLMYACKFCRQDVVDELLAGVSSIDKNNTRSIDIDLRDNNGDTALNLLLCTEHLSNNMNEESKKRKTSSKINIISWLVRENADVNAQGKFGYSPMMTAINAGFYPHVYVDELLKTDSYIDFKKRNEYGYTVLELANKVLDIHSSNQGVAAMYNNLKNREKSDRLDAIIKSTNKPLGGYDLANLLAEFVS